MKKIFVRKKDSIVRLAINEEVIETTEEHPLPFCPKRDSDWLGKTDSVAAKLRRSERSERSTLKVRASSMPEILKLVMK